MSKRGLLAELSDRGLLGYGCVIPSEVIYELLEIVVPEVGTKEQFEKISLMEFSAIQSCRDDLLNQGKYLKKENPFGYRILLPSENAKQVALYMESADRKLNRARKLNATTPVQPDNGQDQTSSRIAMRQNSHRRNYRVNGEKAA